MLLNLSVLLVLLYVALYIRFSLSAVGMYFCFAKLTDHNIFIILYGLTSVYFAVSHVIMCVNKSHLSFLTLISLRYMAAL